MGWVLAWIGDGLTDAGLRIMGLADRLRRRAEAA